MNKQLLEEYLEMCGIIHEIQDGHDPENFRGCTHKDCERRKSLYREANKDTDMFRQKRWAFISPTAPYSAHYFDGIEPIEIPIPKEIAYNFEAVIQILQDIGYMVEDNRHIAEKK